MRGLRVCGEAQQKAAGPRKRRVALRYRLLPDQGSYGALVTIGSGFRVLVQGKLVKVKIIEARICPFRGALHYTYVSSVL